GDHAADPLDGAHALQPVDHARRARFPRAHAGQIPALEGRLAQLPTLGRQPRLRVRRVARQGHRHRCDEGHSEAVEGVSDLRGRRLPRFLVALLFAVTSSGPWVAFAQTGNAQPPAENVTPDPWPKVLKQDNSTYTLFQPQLDSWDGYSFAAHAAVSVL